MIARVTLELALGKEFDYLIPDEMAGLGGSRHPGQGAFCPAPGAGLRDRAAGDFAPSNLRPLIKIIGRQSFVSPKILQLARWMGEYYCCPPEIALENRPARSRAQGKGRLARATFRARPAAPEAPARN